MKYVTAKIWIIILLMAQEDIQLPSVPTPEVIIVSSWSFKTICFYNRNKSQVSKASTYLLPKNKELQEPVLNDTTVLPTSKLHIATMLMKGS